jgi:4'-phosphopantetheinyl transferase
MARLGRFEAIVPVLNPAEIHVWGMIAQPEADHPHFRALLSVQEADRAERFIFPRDRQRFVVSHGLLRTILARYAGKAPQALSFSRRSGGKPCLDGHGDLHFSLAHSGDAILIAVSLAGEVGVDVEELRVMNDAEGLVARFFSESERRHYAELAPQHRAAAFFAGWTRKEAYVKALGSGLSTPLDSFSVNFDVPARLLAPAGPWTLRHLAVGGGYVGAVAMPGADLPLRGGLIEA